MNYKVIWDQNLSQQALPIDPANPLLLFECLGKGEIHEIQLEFNNFDFVLQFVLDGEIIYSINAQDFSNFDFTDLSMKLTNTPVGNKKFYECFSRNQFFRTSFIIKAYSTGATNFLKGVLKTEISSNI